MSANCQIPTPKEYVNMLLDSAGYTNNLYGKKILENSFGEGNILKVIVRRYIVDAIRHKKSNEEIAYGLECDILGYEIDQKCVSKCKEALDSIAKEYSLRKINWRLYEADYLESENEKVDFIIGNPPYITYHDLEEEKRNFIKMKFSTCKRGRCDYYYAFIEKSVQSLSKNGILAYLIPFNIFRNKYAEQTRKLLKPHIKKIFDYSEMEVFPRITIASTIIVYDMSYDGDKIVYKKVKEGINKEISKDELGQKWIFSSNNDKVDRFGDHFSVSNSIATLLNEAFIIKDYSEDEKFTYVDGYKIENNILKYATSPRMMKKNAICKIIFPYKLENNVYSRYEEEEFKMFFPEAYKYLKQFKSKLKKRKVLEETHWFEYGRTQAISNMEGEKLILPMVISKRVQSYIIKFDVIPFAGYFIKRREGGRYSLNDAKKILDDKSFMRYVKEHGTPTTKTSFRISVKDIEEYKF